MALWANTMEYLSMKQIMLFLESAFFLDELKIHSYLCIIRFQPPRK